MFQSVLCLTLAIGVLGALALGAQAEEVKSCSSEGKLPPLRARGASWADTSGNPVILKGCNLGNWFVQEMWMHAMQTEGISDQYTLEQVLTQRFGEEAKNRLLDTYHANFITARDFKIIKSFGMNVVRLPILYSVIDDDKNPYHLRPEAFVHLDRAVAMAEAEGIYTILDLHGAPGSQNPWDHSGRVDQNKLWGNEEYKKRTIWVWRQLAEHYRGRSAVAAYDLLNEPYTAPKEELRDLALALYRAIREVDPDHIIIFPSLPTGFEFYGDLKQLNLKNIALTAHFYPGFFGWSSPTVETHNQWLTEGVKEWEQRVQAAGVPLLVGEMNVVLREAGGAAMMRRAYDTYAGFGWATTMWSYKVFSKEGGIAGGSWGMVTNPPGEGASIDPSKSSLPELEDYFKSLSTMDYVIYDELRQALTGK